MKKFIVFAIGLFVLATFSYSENNVEFNQYRIKDIEEMDISIRLETYNSLKMDSKLPTLLNGLIGFGSGSFSQNDKKGGLIGFVGDSVSLGLIGIGYYGYLKTDSYKTIPYIIMMGLGAVSYFGSKYYQYKTPGEYAEMKNLELWNMIMK
jgi:hypothetical protein